MEEKERTENQAEREVESEAEEEKEGKKDVTHNKHTDQQTVTTANRARTSVRRGGEKEGGGRGCRRGRGA